MLFNRTCWEHLPVLKSLWEEIINTSGNLPQCLVKIDARQPVRTSLFFKIYSHYYQDIPLKWGLCHDMGEGLPASLWWKYCAGSWQEIPTCRVIRGKLCDDLTWHDVSACNLNNTSIDSVCVSLSTTSPQLLWWRGNSGWWHHWQQVQTSYLGKCGSVVRSILNID